MITKKDAKAINELLVVVFDIAIVFGLIVLNFFNGNLAKNALLFMFLM